MTKNSRLRRLMAQPGIIPCPGCHDAFTARLVASAGFDVCYMGGNATMAALLGRPDIGLGTATEMVDRARRIADVLDIPLLCDADTGYGNANNVWRTVRDFEAAGVSGIHIEDQRMPKRCGAMGDLSFVSRTEMAGKVRAAVDARRSPDFVVIARTDVYRTQGLDEVRRRCDAYAEAGADVLMPCGLLEAEKMRRLAAETPVPLLVDICEFDRDRYIFSDAELADIGYKFVVRPVSSILHAGKVFSMLYRHYREHGSTRALFEDGQFMDRAEYQTLLGYETEMDRLARYGAVESV